MEQQIKIAAKLYDCRDTAKRFFKEDFWEKIKPHTEIIKQVMKSNGIGEMKALLKISETEMYQDSGMTQMMFIAAMVELLEPSKPNEQ